MQQDNLDELARRHGIASSYFGVGGTPVETSTATKRRLLQALGIPTAGQVDPAAGRDVSRDPPELRYSGEGCHLPGWLHQGSAWGISLQLYELRSRDDWGIGDFAALARFCRIAAKAGADFVGLTPLHALFLSQPDRCSPFSPSSRRFLNPLYIAVDHVPGYQTDMVDGTRLARLREAEFVDYAQVTDIKLAALSVLWQYWRREASTGEFDVFRERGGQALHRHALFEALSAHMTAQGFAGGWLAWPREYHDPEGEAVAAFAEQHEGEIAFHAWLQWLADTQLADAAAAARQAGMRIGLYVDLAVGEATDGSAVWSDREMFVTGATIGAPPDYFTAEGQEWGVAALSPLALPRNDYAHFTELIEAVARRAGALRIDHVMALWQLFLVPGGCPPGEGAHLRFPISDLLDRLAAFSRREEVIVIGEDLGHVPEGFREIMQDAAILSYRILYFEKMDGGAFRPAHDYPRLSIACLSTHDLATLAGWWRGSDIDLRREHELIDADAARHQAAERDRERHALVHALGQQDHSDADLWEHALATPQADIPDGLAAAVHAFIADTRSVLAAARLADLVGETQPTNLPGTSSAYPNWRRRSAVTLERLEEHARFRTITQAMAERRPRP